jgi:hypothetical protein
VRRSYGVVHGEIKDYDPMQGYLVRMEEHQEDRWMLLPDADVDFVQVRQAERRVSRRH